MKKRITPVESAGLIGYNYKKARRNSGKHINRRFRIALGRVAVAVMTAAVLALSGVLPAGSGRETGLIPATVEAAGPPTGTITFYRYTRLEQESDFPSWFDVFFIYPRGNDWFFTQNVTDINNGYSYWKVKNANVDTRIDPKAKVFQTRNKWSDIELYRATWDGKKNRFTGYYVMQYTNGDYHYVCHTTEYLRDLTDGATLFTPRDSLRWSYEWGYGFLSEFETINNNLVNLRWKPAETNFPERLDWQGWDGAQAYWMVYKIDTVTYNCINANYSIGKEDGSDPQVYQANGAKGGLFLREGVTLTVPKNSILVVKNGPFYVNGTINCYGTILVENGGILTTYDSTDKGSNINLYEGSAMIIRGGGRVYAGCPAGSTGAAKDGWLKVYPGASIVNYGLMVAGKCDFRIGEGSAIVENHEGATMYLGYSVEDEKKFLSTAYTGASTDSLGLARTGGQLFWQASNSNKGKTVFKVWNGATTGFANRHFNDPIKLYSYDKDGKCTVN